MPEENSNRPAYYRQNALTSEDWRHYDLEVEAAATLSTSSGEDEEVCDEYELQLDPTSDELRLRRLPVLGSPGFDIRRRRLTVTALPDWIRPAELSAAAAAAAGGCYYGGDETRVPSEDEGNDQLGILDDEDLYFDDEEVESSKNDQSEKSDNSNRLIMRVYDDATFGTAAATKSADVCR